MSRRVSLSLPLVFAALLVIGYAAIHFVRQAEANGAAILQQPIADCTDTGTDVTLRWLPVDGVTEQWIEYTLHDNDFAEGTFTVIPVEPDATQHTTDALRSDLPNFWRILSTTEEGVVASPTGAFKPCSRPLLLQGPVECRTFDSAAVTFRWAPLAGASAQWLEIDQSASFDGPTARRFGPLAPTQQELQRGSFLSDVTYYFRVAATAPDGGEVYSQTGRFTPECTPVINPELYGSDDKLVIPALGIDAPVNVRDVGFDGELGVPQGALDVVRYNFSLFPNLAADPGEDGAFMVGGHVDFYEHGEAVFWPLKVAEVGQTVEYWDGDVKHTYVIDLVTDLPFDQSLNSYLEAPGEAILLVTCNGTFDREQFGGYDLRRLVRAVPQN